MNFDTLATGSAAHAYPKIMRRLPSEERWPVTPTNDSSNTNTVRRRRPKGAGSVRLPVAPGKSRSLYARSKTDVLAKLRALQREVKAGRGGRVEFRVTPIDEPPQFTRRRAVRASVPASIYDQLTAMQSRKARLDCESEEAVGRSSATIGRWRSRNRDRWLQTRKQGTALYVWIPGAQEEQSIEQEFQARRQAQQRRRAAPPGEL